MSRARTPTNILKLRDAFAKHPERARARANEPLPMNEIGPAPAHLSPKERACYNEIVSLCVPGVLGACDALIVEHAARLLWQLRRGRTYTNAKLQTRLEVTLGKLGLSPADRSRVSVTRPRTENRFRDLARKRAK